MAFFFFICIAVSGRTISVSYRSSRLVLPVGVVVSGARPVSRPRPARVSMSHYYPGSSQSQSRLGAIVYFYHPIVSVPILVSFFLLLLTSMIRLRLLLLVCSRLVSSPRVPVYGDVGRFVRASTRLPNRLPNRLSHTSRVMLGTIFLRYNSFVHYAMVGCFDDDVDDDGFDDDDFHVVDDGFDDDDFRDDLMMMCC